jgi:hypothetical protein
MRCLLQGPKSTSGQPVIFDQVGMLSLSAVPWRQNLLVMLLGLYCYETATELLQKKVAKPKAAAKQQVSWDFMFWSVGWSCCCSC